MLCLLAYNVPALCFFVETVSGFADNLKFTLSRHHSQKQRAHLALLIACAFRITDDGYVGGVKRLRDFTPAFVMPLDKFL
jgi:hypothetical protein